MFDFHTTRSLVLEANRSFEPLKWDGAERPSIHLEDVSGIPFVAGIAGVEEYQHRARVRAKDQDLFVSVSNAQPGYEEYCQWLGLGAPEHLVAEPVEEATRVTHACLKEKAYRSLLEWSRDQPGQHVLIHPYMAIDEVWALAQKLSADGVKPRVVGPPPAVLWLANDKATLTALVAETLGEGWVPKTAHAYSADALSELLKEFAQNFDFVGLKRTRCASAMGNRVFESKEISTLSDQARLALVQEFLADTEWDGREEILVVEWLASDDSPSTQTWIPPLGEGQPRLDGVYEQLLVGVEKMFLGSQPSTLPAELNSAIGEASLRVATALQELGYVGRCSFDFVVGKDGRPRFTECNGRWGGTSTPMHLMDRLFDERPHYVAQDWVEPSLVGKSFKELHQALEPELYNPRTQEGHFILYNVGPITGKGKFDIISMNGQKPVF